MANNIDIKVALQGMSLVQQQLQSLTVGMNALTGAATLWMASKISAPLKAFGQAAIGMAGQMQQAEIGFTTLLRSGEKAKQFLEELRDFAARTPFKFTDLQVTARRMVALGFETQQVIPVLRVLGDTVGSMGGSAEQLNRIIYNMGQLKMIGKVTGHEMRDLAMAGVKAWDYLAAAIGKSVPEAMEMARKGAIDAKTGLVAVFMGMQRDFGGGMEKQMGTLLQGYSNLQDEMEFMLAEIGKTLNETFNISGIIIRVTTALHNLRMGWDEIPGPLKKAAVLIGIFAAVLPPLLLSLGGLVRLASFAGAGLGSLGLSLKMLPAAFGLLSNPIGIVIASLLAIGSAIYILIKYWDNLAYTAEVSMMRMKIVVLNTTADILESLSSLEHVWDKVFAAWAKSFKLGAELGQHLRDAFAKGYVEGMAELFKLGDKIGEAIKAGEGPVTGATKVLRERAQEELGKLTLKEFYRELADSAKNLNEQFGLLVQTMIKHKIDVTALIQQYKAAGGAMDDVAQMFEFLKQAAGTNFVELFGLQAGSMGKNVKEVTETMSDLAAKLLENTILATSVGAKFDKTSADVDAYKQALSALIKLGLTPANKEVAEVIDKLGELSIALDPSSLNTYRDAIAQLVPTIYGWGYAVDAVTTSLKDAQLYWAGLKGPNIKPLSDEDIKVYHQAFSDILTDQENLVKVQDELNKKFKEAETMGKAMGKEFNVAQTKIDAVREAIKTLIDLKFDPMSDAVQTFQQLLKDLGVESQVTTNTMVYENEIIKTAVSGVAEVIKGIWMGTTQTFKDVWHNAANVFIDTMGQMVSNFLYQLIVMQVSAKVAAAQISIAFAAATAGISLVIGMFAQMFGGRKEKKIKVEPLTVRLEKVFTEFVQDFKGALGEFKEALFPPATILTEARKAVELSSRALAEIAKFREAAPTSKYRQAEMIETFVTGLSTIRGTTTRWEEIPGLRMMVSDINTLLRELKISTLAIIEAPLPGGVRPGGGQQAGKGVLISEIEKRIVLLAKKLADSSVEFTRTLVDGFEKAKEHVKEIFDLIEKQKDFAKDIDNSIRDILRSTMSTMDVFKDDMTKVQQAQAALVGTQGELRIELLDELKDAWAEVWDSAKSFFTEITDKISYLLEERETFISSIRGDIKTVSRSLFTVGQMFRAQIGDIEMLQQKIASSATEKRPGLLDDLKQAWLDVWSSAQSFFSEITDKITSLIGQRDTFVSSVQDAITSISRSLFTTEQLFQSQIQNVEQLRLAIQGVTGEQRISLLDKLKQAYLDVWQTAQQLFDTKGIQSRVEELRRDLISVNRSIVMELDPQQRLKLEAQALQLQNELTVLTEQGITGQDDLLSWQEAIVAGLEEVKEAGKSEFQQLIEINQAMLDELGSIDDWQAKVIAALTGVEIQGTDVFDALVAVNQAMLDEMGSIDNWQQKVVDGLGSVKQSGIIEFDKLIDIQLEALGLERIGNDLETQMVDYIIKLTTTINNAVVLIKEMNDMSKAGTLTYAVIEGGLGELLTATTMISPLLIEGLASTITDALREITDQTIVPTAMQHGGIVTRPTLAMIGEAGSEAVVPLNQLRGSGGGKGNDIYVTLQGPNIMDEITFAKWSRKLTSAVEREQARYA